MSEREQSPRISETEWLDRIFARPELMCMGHDQSATTRNLGLGWLYYALARVERPTTVVCIGSWRGFVPIVLGRALADNAEGGRVCFIDPSLVDDFWVDAGRTRAWFAGFGLDNVDHHCVTTQDFAGSAAHRALRDIGLLFVDGYHTAEQAAFDFATFEGQLAADASVLFHDSVRHMRSPIYGPDRVYEHTVVDFMARLAGDPRYRLVDFVAGSGVTLLKRSRGEVVTAGRILPTFAD